MVKPYSNEVAVLKIRRLRMEQEKTKKKGRPAQLLKIAELSAFVAFLKAKNERSELQNQVIDSLQQKDFNFELLSEAQQILVKEALKPYREHTKLTILAEQLHFEQNRSEYENKFLQLYQEYKKGQLDQTDLNLLKTMCTRYLNYKAQKLQLSDLELYLSQIQKKEAKKKRSAENQRKFEIGGGVLSFYKTPNDDSLDAQKFLNKVQTDRYLARKLRQSSIFKKVGALDIGIKEKYELLFEVLNQLTLYGNKGETVKFVDFAIEEAQTKLKRKIDPVAE